MRMGPGWIQKPDYDRIEHIAKSFAVIINLYTNHPEIRSRRSTLQPDLAGLDRQVNDGNSAR